MFDALETNIVDIITLDLTLGNDSGLEIAKQIRRKWDIPVLMITGKATPSDRLNGLETGADDYIVKPFMMREVILRVRRTLTLYGREIARTSSVAFDSTTFELGRSTVKHADGSSVELTEIEVKLLEIFVRHPGRIMNRDQLSRAVLGRPWSPQDRVIDGHVARLRRKLEHGSEELDLIRSVRGIGYLFSCEVKLLPR
ncbi:Phosphate regulon transcriptional regulatory protein PhoB (plasmid) [Paracoccaceae bacterium]|nr:Phosphate regulon transcriptional regulatory protein PhoB [Paracoccaceae bacterium]